MTETELANIALGHLGSWRLTNWTDQTPEAGHVRRMWGITRDELFRARHWNFALKLATLSRFADAPAFGYAYRFQLPPDYALAYELNGRQSGTGEAKFDIFGVELHCDDETAELIYVSNATPVQAWDAAFCDAFTLSLAARIAPSLSSATGLAERLAAQADAAALRAFGPDNLETRPRAVLAQTGSSWLASRMGMTQ